MLVCCRIGDGNQRAAAAERSGATFALDSHGASISR